MAELLDWLSGPWDTARWTLISAVAALVSALGGVGALVFISKQIKTSRQISACEFILSITEKYQSPEPRDKRTRLAKHLLMNTEVWEALTSPAVPGAPTAVPTQTLRGYVDPVLSDFERLGMMLRKGLVPKYFVWTGFFYRVSHYYELLERYIGEVRAKEKSRAYYQDFEYLYRKLRSYHVRHSRPGMLRLFPALGRQKLYGRAKLHDFLVRECQVKIRPLDPADIDDTLVPAALEERLQRFRTSNSLVAVAEILSRNEPDHDFVGYVVARMRNGEMEGCGEIREMYVDQRFRRLKIGTRLCDYACNEIGQWENGSCSVTVQDDDLDVIEFYQRQKFTLMPGSRANGRCTLVRILHAQKAAAA